MCLLGRNLKFTLRHWSLDDSPTENLREGEGVSVDHAEWYSLATRVLNPIKKIAAERPDPGMKQLSSAQHQAFMILRCPLSTMCFPVLAKKLWVS
jgi:hypothetical protein